MTPAICQKNLILNNKLNTIKTPVLYVAGTSSKQGKFTVQHIITSAMRQEGYLCGNLGTEPSSPLFNFDGTILFGYGSECNLTTEQFISCANDIVYQIDKQNKDIIITGGQSGCIPYLFSNQKWYYARQHEFIYAVQPDSYVLCVNEYDEITYIDRTVKYLEGVSKAKVIAIIVSSSLSDVMKKENGAKPVRMTELKEKYDVPVFALSELDVENRNIVITIEKHYTIQ